MISALAAMTAMGVVPLAAQAQTWTPLKNQPTFNPASIFLMTDGTILAHDEGTCGCGANDWWKLTPDKTGSYVNGTWTEIKPMPSGYMPLYYASEVLPDGELIVQGGEYNGSGNGVWTTKGALYDPVKNKWTTVAPPTGWSTIGDAQSTLLGDGTYMLANCCNTDEVTLNVKTMKYKKTGKDKADDDDEEGWTLLPSGQVLTVDTWDPPNTEILTNGKWASAGDTPVQLPDTNSKEMGPQVLRPDGTVFAVGANSAGYTAIYNIAAGTWSQGPTLPAPKGSTSHYDEADGPATLLPDGNVLMATSPGVFNTPVQFFEFDGTNVNKVPNTPNSPNDSSFYFRLLTLPTGQVLATDGSNDVEVYTPSGSANSAWQPVITTFSTTVTPGKTYKLTGTYLNGFSQAVAYGDDYQAPTNYPIVEITNTATGDVQFAKTSDDTSYLPANPNPVTAKVKIPKTIETGPSTMVVIANGIASAPFSLTVQ
jgi:hypothetical protein